MNNPSQRPQPAEPDMVLLFLGSFLEDLLHAPVRDDAKVDALAMQILDEGPKTLLGLVMPPSLLAKKKERSGLQSACDELIDKGAIHHSE